MRFVLILVLCVLFCIGIMFLMHDQSPETPEALPAETQPVPEKTFSPSDAQSLERTPQSKPRLASPEKTIPQTSEAPLEAPQTETLPVNQTGITICGIISNKQGIPIPEASFSVYGSETNTFRGSSSGSGGDYAVAGMTPGKWHIVAWKIGYRRFDGEITIAPSSPIQQYNICMQQAIVIGIRFITGNGQPLVKAIRAANPPFRTHPELHVLATETPIAGDLPETEMHSVELGEGTFYPGLHAHALKASVPQDCDGRLEVPRLPLYASVALGTQVLETKFMEPGTTIVEFTVSIDQLRRSLATVRARIVDEETGGPLTRGYVSLNSRQSEGGGVAISGDGTVVIPDQKPGRFILTISGAPGYEHYEAYVKVETGEHDLGDIRVGRGTVTLSGIVADSEGNPIDVNLRWFRMNRKGEKFPPVLSFAGNSAGTKNGAFAIRNIGKGEYFLFTTEESWARTVTVVDCSAGSVSDLRITLTRGTPVTFMGSFLEAESARYLLTVRDASGYPLLTARFGGLWPIRASLAPGSYAWELDTDERLTKISNFTVTALPLHVSVSP
jgi:hypothetical protein